MINYCKLAIIFLLMTIKTPSTAQTIIAQWDFDTGSYSPSMGLGEAFNIGGTNTNWVSGNPASGLAWNTSAYPAITSAPGTAGVQFNVSTEGYENILITWENRNSNTAANRNRLQYTVDGITWVNFEACESNASNMHGTINSGFDAGRYITDVAASWYIRTADFSEIAGCSDNPLFGVRIVTEFESNSYVATNQGSNYGSSGTIRFENVSFSGSEAGSSAALSANPSSLSGFTYAAGSGPSTSKSYTLSGSGLIPPNGSISIIPSFFYEVSLNNVDFSENTLTVPYSGSTLTSVPVYVRLKAGLSPGSYNAEAIVNTGGGAAAVNVVCYGEITNPALPTATVDFLPLYISGNTPANSRVPYAFCVTLHDLMPNAVYKYLNQAVVASDEPTTAGAGVLIYLDIEKNFIRNSLGNFNTPGEYGEFTTDANGSYTGWFILEPTENERFNAGNEVFMRIRLNNGTGGNTTAHYLTIEEPVNVLKYATTTGSVNGTGIRALSDASPGNFALLYSNPDGTGRPLFGTTIESTGIDFAGIEYYAGFYREDVAGITGAWGGIIPNSNAEGIRRIEERSLDDGSLLNAWTSENGVWGTTDTRNPQGGVNKELIIDLISIDIPVISKGSEKIRFFQQNLTIEPNSLKPYTFMIYDLQGKAIAGYELCGKQLIMINLKSGFYIGCLKMESTVATVKLVIP